MHLRFILMSGFLKTVRKFPVPSEKVIILLCAFTIHTKQHGCERNHAQSTYTVQTQL